LPQTIDDQLEIKADCRQAGIESLGTERIGLAVEFLRQEVQFAANAAHVAAQKATRRLHMRLQAINLLAHVQPRDLQGKFLGQAFLGNGRRHGKQFVQLLPQPGPQRLRAYGLRGSGARREGFDLIELGVEHGRKLAALGGAALDQPAAGPGETCLYGRLDFRPGILVLGSASAPVSLLPPAVRLPTSLSSALAKLAFMAASCSARVSASSVPPAGSITPRTASRPSSRGAPTPRACSRPDSARSCSSRASLMR